MPLIHVSDDVINDAFAFRILNCVLLVKPARYKRVYGTTQNVSKHLMEEWFHFTILFK